MRWSSLKVFSEFLSFLFFPNQALILKSNFPVDLLYCLFRRYLPCL